MFLIPFFFLISTALAFTHFNPNCTTPNTVVNFVSTPNSRGTLNILWSCLFTIIACTWSIQHLNIPESPIEPPAGANSWIRAWYSFKNVWKKFQTSLKWMLFTISEAEIRDKNKSSVFVKALAVIQIILVSAEVIVRHSRGLSVSQLEIVVCAFSLCALVTYIFLFRKPQGVEVPSRPIRIDRGHLKAYDHPRVEDWYPLRNYFIPGKMLEM
ncbi:hypothetical protein B0O99DRAFT_328402 [Bisporella sp. PMI_857]|nr:hypothetical protein B0O99DRAFT_364495 [Bisporella sp. PMI_857]KAH8600551.1 hypothetical protein B0O99DRAFT_328402 [Bisporella sp. PMI_857]